MADRGTAIREALRDKGFWLLTVAFIANSTAIATLSIHLITYLTSRGLAATTATTVATMAAPSIVVRAGAPVAAAAAPLMLLPILVGLCSAAAAVTLAIAATDRTPADSTAG